MKTQFIIVGICEVGDMCMTEIAPAKCVKCLHGIVPEHPLCAWCGSDETAPMLDIIQHDFFHEDKCWTVFKCCSCLCATVFTYELQPGETPVPVTRG